MARHEVEGNAFEVVLKTLSEQGFEGMGRAIEILMNEAMKLERSEYLGAASHERVEERRGYANGFKAKRVDTRLGRLELEVPQVRALPGGPATGFYPQALERGERSERALKLAVAEMYLQGVSTRRVAQITQELCGLDITSMQVSRATALLDVELEQWRNRELGACRYLILDARYEKVRHGGSVVDSAVLVALAVREDGHRQVIGVSVSLSEAEVHWRTFLESLKARGLRGVRMIVSDSHSGLRAALAATFPGTPWQRCQFHLQQNAAQYVPHVALREEVASDLRRIFGARDRADADDRLREFLKKYHSRAPRLVQWAEEAIPQGLTVFELPDDHQRRMRTSNGVERVNRELARRTRVATLFPNEASLLRLATAILAEISEEWETGRVYLTLQADS